jgi:hypothetical protein
MHNHMVQIDTAQAQDAILTVLRAAGYPAMPA